MDGETFNHGERPTLWERLGALAGHTTYREPVGGRTSRHGAIPADHVLCIALGMARRRDDPLDIGPDIAFDIATQSSRHQRAVCTALAKALAATGTRNRGSVRRSRPYMLIIARNAYLLAVYEQETRQPDGITDADWQELTEAGYRVLMTMADDAIDRAARRLRGRD